MAREGIERRLAAISSADVIGYSRVMGEDEAGTLARLNAHRTAFIDPTIAEYQGRIVNLLRRTRRRPLIERPGATARRTWAWLGAAVLATISLAAPSQAHFLMTETKRVVHVAPHPEGLQLYIRLPLALPLAGKAGGRLADGSPKPAPYTVIALEGDRLVHYVDSSQIRGDALGLGRLVADGHRLVFGNVAPGASVEAVRVYPAAEQPPFSTLAEARAALVGASYSAGAPPLFVGDATIDVQLYYAAADLGTRFELSSSLNPDLAGVATLENLIYDHRGDATQVYRATGSLASPVTISPSALSAAANFIVQGFYHIIEGIDHVLFVLCLTIGAAELVNLLWRVTGFTLGHTVTLIGGFLGYAPSAAWFIPAVETAIALSIIYAGVVAILQRPGAATFVVTTVIGLLHGLGFAFVLGKILEIDSPNLTVSLLSFNLGVEVGQITIILAVWPALFVLARRSARYATYARVAVAVPCISVASFWTLQRLAALA